MEPWYKFILYGTYDGFSRSTLGDDNLYLVLENGEKVEIPRCFVKNASDFIEKDKLKLKDVIARIKKLDLGSQELWLNEILNKLGSDYGSLKYRAGYEQGKFDCAMERDKVTVPQFVADYIRYAIENDWDFQDLFKCIEDEEDEELLRWVYHERNQETLAAAWVNGYTVEKEKRYIVKVKGISVVNGCLKCDVDNAKWFFSGPEESDRYRAKHTIKELEQAGFGWVFDCPGVEVEEVKG